MKRYIMICALIMILQGCNGDDGGIDTEIAVPVSVREVRLGPIEEYIVTTGTVKAVQEVSLHSEAAGYYSLLENPGTGRRFRMGDAVMSGRPVIRLDNPEFESSVKIESVKLNLETSRREYEKQKSLYDKGGVTLRELRDAERLYIDARYGYENAQIQLAKLDVTPPFDGILVDLPYYTEGTMVASGELMAAIMNYASLYLDVSLPGGYWSRIAVGQPARVMNYSLPDDTLHGTVVQLSPAVDPDTRSFKVSVAVDNPRLLMRPGMFAKAEIIVARKDSAVVIPKDIIMSRRRGKTIFVVVSSAAKERLIATGLENPYEVEVIEGLEANERLVIKGFETLRRGSKVKVIR